MLFRSGDTIRVLVQGPPVSPKVVGIAKFGTADSPGGATVAAFETSVAQRLVAQAGMFDTIAVVGSDQVSQETLAGRVASALPAGTEAVTGATVTKENQDEIHKALGFFTTFMLVFAGVALLVGAFMIYNTFSITVAQRTRENGMLRALGASRRQVLAAVLVEALLVGALASATGLALGVAVAAGLEALLDAVGMDIPAGGLVFAPRTAVVSVLVGVGVTLAAAVGPARRAARVSPIEAMAARTAGTAGTGSRRRIAFGATLLAAGVGTLMTGLGAQVSHRASWVGVGVLAVFFAVAVLGGTISLPLSRAIGAPIARLRGITGELARENAMRNPRRTAATASALMIGVGLVGFITVFVDSAKTSVTAAVDRAFIGDLILDSGAGLTGGIDPGLAGKLAALPQVAVATGVRVGSVKVGDRVVQIAAFDPQQAMRIGDIGLSSGSLADLASGLGVQVDEAAAKGLHLGDAVPVVFKDTGTKTLTVAALYRDRGAVGDYVLGRAAYDANVADHYDWQVWVKSTPGTTPAAARAAVEQTAAAYPGVDVLTRDEYTAKALAPMNQMLALVYALLALAVLIALLGIANTLALSIYERTREIGLLRAVGMTRHQLRSTVRWESVIIALQGTLLGLVIGTFFGWALVRALHDQGIDLFHVPFGGLAVIVAIAACSGVLAALAPSRRAARLNVLRAMASN